MPWISIIPGSGRFPFMVIALFVLTGISCAKQGYPPGGPADDIPPELVRTIPAANTINVSTSEPLVFEFSEPMDEKSVEENLFIVPIPSTWPEFEWSSRSRILVLKPNQPLRDNTTYVITIGAKARDLRRNGLEDSIMLSFSTGDVIEDKRIKGKAIPYDYLNGKGEKVSEIDIVAYRLNNKSSEPDPGNDVPDYFTQTGQDGSYEILGLASSLYRIFAIGDKDKDGFYTEGYDLIGVMPHDVSLSESDSIQYAPEIMVSSRLISEIQLTSVRAPDSLRIELFFDREVEIESLKLEIEGLNVIGWFADEDRARSISVVTDEQENKKRYMINSIDVSDRDGNNLMSFESRPFYNGTDRPDTTSLEIVDWSPKILSSADEHISLVFNRMLDFPDGIEGIIEDESGENVSVKRTGTNKLELAPVESWQSSYNYVILFDSESLRGIAGNRLTDSGAELAFRVVPSDTLGFIEGNIEDYTEKSASSYRLIFKNLDTDTVKEFNFTNPEEWSSGPVLPGRYIGLAHRDDDRDGKIFRGTVNPYMTAEQVVVYPDTIMVEPRWPVKDINFIFK